MKRTIFAAIAVVSITVVAGIDAAEVRKALTALRAQPIPTDTFNSNLPRHSVGYYRYAVDLTVPGPSRQTIEANDFTTLWHEKRNGNTTLYGKWNHTGKGALASPTQDRRNTQECVEEVRPEGNRYECAPNSSNDAAEFTKLKSEFNAAASEKREMASGPAHAAAYYLNVPR